MNRKLLCAAMLALSVAPLAVPTQAATEEKKEAAATAPNPAEFDKQMAQALENMKTMQAQMERLQATKDPQERQKLLQEHWDAMQATMGSMRGMWGPGMMGGGAYGKGGGMMGGGMMGGPMMGWGHMGGYYSKLTPEQMKERQYMMDQYMGMQQNMMNHMMWHQQYLQEQQEQKPAPKP